MPSADDYMHQKPAEQVMFMIASEQTGCAGGVGAPELTEELKNFSITAGAAAVLGFIFQRDLSGQLRDGAAIEREEALGRLLVCLQFWHVAARCTCPHGGALAPLTRQLEAARMQACACMHRTSAVRVASKAEGASLQSHALARHMQPCCDAHTSTHPRPALMLLDMQIDLGKDRILPIASLRGRVRPVILAGTESYIRKVWPVSTWAMSVQTSFVAQPSVSSLYTHRLVCRTDASVSRLLCICCLWLSGSSCAPVHVCSDACMCT